ncbi:MAG: DNA polymerase III subunit delta' [Paracoccaceae bacterium]
MANLTLQDQPEPDCLIGTPHPRLCAQVYGHKAAETTFLVSYRAGRLHHAWLIEGPRGVGKSSLAWKMMRFLLATPEDDGGMFASKPPKTLCIAKDHPVVRRINALSEPRLFLLRRGMNTSKTGLAAEILVDEVRKLKHFFQMSAADGGRRVAIIDSADDLNPHAANALLKVLEEPPAEVTLFLIAHQPWRLLPTLRSRCRNLRLDPLQPEVMAMAMEQAGAETQKDQIIPLSELAAGSVGVAMSLQNQSGLQLYSRIVKLFATLPHLNRTQALDLCDTAAGRGTEMQFDLILSLIDLFLVRLAKAGSMGYAPPEAAPDEARVITRLAPTRRAARAWAYLGQTLSLRARQGRAVNLDPAALLMDMILKIDEAASQSPIYR